MANRRVEAIIDELLALLRETDCDETQLRQKCEDSKKKLEELRESDQKKPDENSERLRTELELHRRMDEVKTLANKNRALQDDVLSNRGYTLKMLRFFESKAKVAEKRILELSQELVKSQEIAKRYQQAYDQAMNEGQFQGDGTAAKDNDKQQIQMMTQENSSLRREITRLHAENTALMRKVKVAEDDRQLALKLYNTSEASREELTKQLRKKKEQEKQRNKVLTRQAASWVSKKKELKVMEEEMRWSLITTTPVFHGDQGSVYGHVPKGVYLPNRHGSSRPVSSLPPAS